MRSNGIKPTALKPVTAQLLYKAITEADARGSYNEIPSLVADLADALGLDLDLPAEFLWGDWQTWQVELARAVVTTYPKELLMGIFPDLLNAVFCPTYIEIFGRGIISGLSHVVPVDTGLKDVISVGYIADDLCGYDYQIKKTLSKPAEKPMTLVHSVVA